MSDQEREKPKPKRPEIMWKPDKSQISTVKETLRKIKEKEKKT